MSVRLRFSRVGRPHDPYFRLVATDRRSARDAAPIEVLGTYNPRNVANPDGIKVERIAYWMSVGAEVSGPVVHALKKSGVWAQMKAPVAAVAAKV